MNDIQELMTVIQALTNDIWGDFKFQMSNVIVQNAAIRMSKGNQLFEKLIP